MEKIPRKVCHIDTIDMTLCFLNRLIMKQRYTYPLPGFFLCSINKGERLKEIEVHMSPRKKKNPTFHYTGWLIGGILVMIY